MSNIELSPTQEAPAAVIRSVAAAMGLLPSEVRSSKDFLAPSGQEVKGFLLKEQ